MKKRYNDFLVDLAMLLKQYDYRIETIDGSGAIWIDENKQNTNVEKDEDHIIWSGELSFNKIGELLSEEENKTTLRPSADSIEKIKFEINGNDFINGKYDQIFWAPEHRSMDDGSYSFQGVYKDDMLYLSIRRSGFIEIVVRSQRIPKNVLENKKFLVYVTPYYNELNIDFEEVF